MSYGQYNFVVDIGHNSTRGKVHLAFDHPDTGQQVTQSLSPEQARDLAHELLECAQVAKVESGAK